MKIELTADGGELYLQIAAAIRRSIADGEWSVGDRLPPARELAAALDVNFHTVRRAYGELVDDGLIDLRRGRGATVISGSDASARVDLQVDALIAAARRVDVGLPELIARLERRYGASN